MMRENGPAVTGIGMYVPEKIVTNEDLSRIVDTSDDWIRKRTGIRTRRNAAPEQATSDLVFEAATQALEMAHVDSDCLDRIIVATATPDFIFPTTSAIVQGKLNATNASVVDVAAACTGGIEALSQAFAYHASGLVNTSLVAGAETLSRVIDSGDRTTSVLFGDGAGAVVIQTIKNPGPFEFYLRADGKLCDLLMIPAGGSRFPASSDTVAAKMHTIKMDGTKVYKHAVEKMSEAATAVLQKAHMTNSTGAIDMSKVNLVIPHQANMRIMNAVWDKLGVPHTKRFANIDKYGNTSAASIFIAMYEAYQQGKLHKDDILLLVAFGAGFTWGAAVFQWHLDPPDRGMLQRFTNIFHR